MTVEPDLAVIALESRSALFNKRVAPVAERFYSEIAGLLHRNGFRVNLSLDRRVSVAPRAAVWIVHGDDVHSEREGVGGRTSRQVYTLGHVTPRNSDMRVLVLQTLSSSLSFRSWDDRATAPAHYVLSDVDRERLLALRPR